MVREGADLHIAERYLHLLGGGAQVRQAVLACSAALRLDDDVARDAIALVAQTNGSTDAILRRIKGLGCVWHQWDGTWYLTEEIRSYLADRLEAETPAAVRERLRELLAEHADRRLAKLSPDGPLTSYRARATKIEAAYQKILTSGQANEGGKELGDLWRESKGTAKTATCEAVAHLAPELEARLRKLPAEVLFLRGMTAYQHGDRRSAEKDFRLVYESGQPGEIYAIAAHLFGNMVRDPKVAEQALRDSIRWQRNPEDKALVWHSLGNLLSKDRPRWDEAESAYRTSLQMRHDPEHQGQVWHSLGNLLSKNRPRWDEAESAYRKSLELLHDPEDKAQVWHSLGNLLSKDRRRWDDAKSAYHKSLEMRHDPADKAQVWHSLGNLLTRQGKLAEAEDAYLHSFELYSADRHRSQVRASWAGALMKLGGPNAHDQAERFALESLALDPDNPKTCGMVNRVLADLYEQQGELGKAIEFLQALQDTNKKLKIDKYREQVQQRIERLRKRIGSAPKTGA